MANIEIYISYAWEETSHKIADSLYDLLKRKKYKVTLDKKDLTYKDNIDQFESRIGEGHYIITIISDKYLKSEHCMNEILHIERSERVCDRIFPVILDDARGIYKPLNRLKYQTYWKDKIDEFKEEMRKHDIDGGLDESTKELKKWQQIKLIFDQITALLASMNVLTPDKHLNSDFSELITKLEDQIKKDRVHNDREDQKDLIIKSLKSQIKSLQFTTNIFEEFSSTDSSYGIFNKVVDLGVEELKADKVFFHIYSEDEASLVLVAKSSSDFQSDQVLNSFGKDIAKKSKICIIESLKKDHTPCLISDCRSNEQLDDPVRSFMAVPLTIRDKIFGVASVFIFREGHTFSEKDVYDMSLIIQQAASAIENIALYENIYENLFSTLSAFVTALEVRDLYTRKHSTRVAKYAHMIAEEMGCSEEELDVINVAGNLHDIGKIGIRDDILLKPGRLTDEEYEKIKEHSVIGADIVSKLGLWDREMEIIRHHHERFDGKGYPDGLIRKEIPLLARVLFVAECFDAMTSDSVYRKKIEKKTVIEWIRGHSGKRFDPNVVDTFLKIKAKVHQSTN